MGSEVTRSGVRGQLLGSEVRNGGHSAEVTVWGQRSPFGVRGHSSGMVFGVGGHGWRSEVTIWGQRSQCEVRGRGQTLGGGPMSQSGVRGHRVGSEVTVGAEVRGWGQRSEVRGHRCGLRGLGGGPGGFLHFVQRRLPVQRHCGHRDPHVGTHSAPQPPPRPPTPPPLWGWTSPNPTPVLQVLLQPHNSPLSPITAPFSPITAPISPSTAPITPSAPQLPPFTP